MVELESDMLPVTISTLCILTASMLVDVVTQRSAPNDSRAKRQNAAACDVCRERLIKSARAGGDYLLRMQRKDGGFHYYYNAAADRVEPRTYNIVRHAGTTLSLLDLYATTRNVRYLESAHRAVKFLEARFRVSRDRSSVYVLDFDGKAKLGANGLALVAVTRLIELDPRSVDRSGAIRLANLIVSMQRGDGSFEMRYRLQTESPEGIESLYYPGEAILGLIRLFKLNNDKRYLDAARRGADYLIKSQRSMDVLPADAWLMQALDPLYAIGHEKRYADHAIALAEAMIADQYTEKDPDGYAGGFGPGPPRATPAASRAEGLVAAYRIAKAAGDERASLIANALKACARFQLAQQLRAANSTGLLNPRRADGGFREGLGVMKIRIDYVQHNISSLLAVAQALF